MSKKEGPSPEVIAFGIVASCLIFIFAGIGAQIGSDKVMADWQYPNALLTDGSRAMEADLDMGGNSITNIDEVDGIDLQGSHTQYYQIRCDEFGRPNTNPPDLVEKDNVLLYSYSVDTDKAFYKLPVPGDYVSGDLTFTFYWTNDGGVDDNGKAVKWQLDYQITAEGEVVSGSYADSPESIEDAYTSSSGWIEHISGAITIEDEDFESTDCIFIQLSAITPTGDPLTCEPHLIGACLIYTSYNIHEG